MRVGGSFGRVLVAAATAVLVANAAGAATPSQSSRPVQPDTLVVGRHDGLYIVRTDGRSTPLLVRNGKDPAWSPDGRQIAYSDWRLRGIWVIHADGSGRRRLTWTPPERRRKPCCGVDDAPSWSPDGRRIV